MAKMWEASGEARDLLLAANVNISEQENGRTVRLCPLL